MLGPEIIARSISAVSIYDNFNNRWQYHSQSDRHSKITCWSIMFDLLTHCSLLREHATAGKVGFGINLTLRDFETRRKKDLDLVVATPSTSETLLTRMGKVIKRPILTFADLAAEYELKLTREEQAILDKLPEMCRVAVGSVCIALEAKAVMTAHVKALPRLHDELDSSHLTVHGHSDHSVAAALVTINASSTFLSPKMNQFDITHRPPFVNHHTQPKDAERTIEKVVEIRRRNVPGQQGFDAIGIMLVDFKNDGSPCRVVSGPPSPRPGDPVHYSSMVERIASQYRAKYPSL